MTFTPLLAHLVVIDVMFGTAEYPLDLPPAEEVRFVPHLAMGLGP